MKAVKWVVWCGSVVVLPALTACSYMNLGVTIPVGSHGGVGVSVGSDGSVGVGVGASVGGGSVGGQVGVGTTLPRAKAPPPPAPPQKPEETSDTP